MTAIDILRLAAEIATPLAAVGGSYLGAVRIGIRLGRMIERQDRQLEWQSRALESQLAHSGSERPPPREKLATLDDPWDTIEAEARDAHYRDRR